MSKKAEENSVAIVVENKNPLAVLGDDIVFDSNGSSGFENVTADDVSIPFVKILQALSPQVRGATKIPGAAEGKFFNTVTLEIYEPPVAIVPCAYQKVFIEWVPRDQGGGFVQSHSDSAILLKTTKNDKKQDMLPNGHTVVTTALHYVLIVKADGSYSRAVISMTSTQLKKSRRWLSQMMSLQLTIAGKKITPPMYSHSYEFSSVPEENDYGSWSGFAIGSPVLLTSKDLYNDAKKFMHDISAGIVKAADPIDDEANAPVDTGSDVSDKM